MSAYSRWGARLAFSSPSSSSNGDSSRDESAGDETEDDDAFDAGTKGSFDEPRYRYAISPGAQDDWGVSECFGKGAPALPEWRRSRANDSGAGDSS